MTDKKQMTQEAVFKYLTFEITARIEWIEDDTDYSLEFFNPNTGWTNSSNPASIMSNWSYQDNTDNYEIWCLITAIQLFDNWTEHLTWEDKTTDTFEFEWHDNEYSNEVAHYNDDGEPTYYKELTLMKVI